MDKSISYWEVMFQFENCFKLKILENISTPVISVWGWISKIALTSMLLLLPPMQPQAKNILFHFFRFWPNLARKNIRISKVKWLKLLNLKWKVYARIYFLDILSAFIFNVRKYMYIVVKCYLIFMYICSSLFLKYV